LRKLNRTFLKSMHNSVERPLLPWFGGMLPKKSQVQISQSLLDLVPAE
jgi:hypothetical protein